MKLISGIILTLFIGIGHICFVFAADNQAILLDTEDYMIEEKEDMNDQDISFDNIVSAYERFLQNNYVGDYYAIVNAGEDQEPLLLVTSAFSENDEDVYIPDKGYTITIYGYRDSEVRQLGEPAAQSLSSGPWYFYDNKLISFSRKGGYYTTDFAGDTYTRNIHKESTFEDEEIDWEVITLQKNKGNYFEDNENVGVQVDKKIEGSELKLQAIAEVEAVEVRAAEIEQLMASEKVTQIEIYQYIGEIYQIWDYQLNLLWSYLKESLPPEEMEELRQEELEWITYKEDEAAAAGNEFEYGSAMQRAAAIQKETELTRERVYELLEKIS